MPDTFSSFHFTMVKKEHDLAVLAPEVSHNEINHSLITRKLFLQTL